MKKHLLLLTALSFGLFACTDETLSSEENADNNIAQEEQTPSSNLQTAKLASFASSQDRVIVYPTTRDSQPGKLELIAEIENLSKDANNEFGFSREEFEDGTYGRYLSATCVYFDQNTDTYYVTYHMQGNNYNTSQINETGGFIENFTLEEVDGKIVPKVGKVFKAADPSSETFDFNHLYFDNLSEYYYTGEYGQWDNSGTRLIAVGHISEPTSTGKRQTKAIIGQLNLNDNPEIKYSVVYTGDKILDENGKSLGKEDAGDVNCVLRKNNYYYLATRKGFASLSANSENLFTPFMGLSNNKNYFLKTKGSAKYLSHDCVVGSSHLAGLYLTENTPSDYSYDTAIKANIVKFGTYNGWFCGADTSQSGWNIDDAANLDEINWPETTELPEVSPVDGKNVLYWKGNYQFYVALGKGGLYVFDPDYSPTRLGDTITFGDTESAAGRPVNGIYVEDADSNIGHPGTDGFIYVANGGCITILNRKSLEKVAERGTPLGEEASANFVQVVNAETETTQGVPDRYVIVAYGQKGVKIFKFIPPTK